MSLLHKVMQFPRMRTRHSCTAKWKGANTTRLVTECVLANIVDSKTDHWLHITMPAHWQSYCHMCGCWHYDKVIPHVSQPPTHLMNVVATTIEIQIGADVLHSHMEKQALTYISEGTQYIWVLCAIRLHVVMKVNNTYIKVYRIMWFLANMFTSSSHAVGVDIRYHHLT